MCAVIEVEVNYVVLLVLNGKGESGGIETRGVSDYVFIHSIYFRDPNGYVIELTAKTGSDDATFNSTAAHATLKNWQAGKADKK